MPDIFDAVADEMAGPEPVSRDIFDDIADEQTVATAPAPQAGVLARAGSAIAENSAIALQGLQRIGKSVQPYIPFGAAIGAIPGAEEAQQAAGSAVGEFARDVQDRAPQDYGVDPNDQRFSSKVIKGGASILPVLASGGTLAPLTGAALAGESSRQDAEARGASEGQQDATFALNAVVGAVTERLLGLPKILKMAGTKRITGEGLNAIAARAALNAVKASGMESGQESIQTLAENFIASDISAYDPDRPLSQGVGDAAAVGAIVGGGLGAATSAGTQVIEPPQEQTQQQAPKRGNPPDVQFTEQGTIKVDGQELAVQDDVLKPVIPGSVKEIAIRSIVGQPQETTTDEATISDEVVETPEVEAAPVVEEIPVSEPVEETVTPEEIPPAIEEPSLPATELQSAQSLGPGAASASEPLTQYEERKFGKRFQESKDIDPTIREETGNRYYEPIPNIQTVQEAESIIDQRGIPESARIVRDESFPMESRVRTVMAQGVIKKLNQQYQKAKAANDPAAEEILNQTIDTAEALGELGTKLGQGVQAFSVWSRLTPEGQLLAFRRMVKKKKAKTGEVGVIPTKVAGKILTDADDIQKTPEGFQRDEKQMDLMAYMANQSGLEASDIPVAIWYANILSGYSTQLVNTVDTGLNVLSESVAMAASHPTAIPSILSGLYQGMIRGGFEAASVLKTGKSTRGDKLQVPPVLERTIFGKKGGVSIPTTSRTGRFFKRALESKVAKPLNLWKYPLRAMLASDTVFYHSMKEARARVLARSLAKKEGLKGGALYRRTMEILNVRPSDEVSAEQQAKSEGLTGNRFRRRVREISEQKRPAELVSNADEAALIATYNHDPTGVLGLVASKISEITEGFKLAKAIVPFTRIVANVSNRGLDYTPWGYKRLFFGQWGGSRFETASPVGEQYRSQLVKATLGTVAMTVIAALDAEDEIQITASGPDDPAKRNQLKNAGWKPYSVRVGDKYYSYQYTPLNLGFAMIGHYRDAVRYNKLSEKDALTRLAYGALKSGSTIFEMSFLSGVSNFLETISGATSSTTSAGKLFSRTVTSAVIPNLVKQIDRLFDPKIYQSDDIQQALIRETPIARGNLKPMLNVLGEPIRYDNNRFFSSASEDPVWKLIIDKQAWISVPGKTTRIGNEPITPEQYYELIQKSGPRIRSYIERNYRKLQGMSDEAADEAITKEAQRIRAEVKSKMR